MSISTLYGRETARWLGCVCLASGPAWAFGLGYEHLHSFGWVLICVGIGVFGVVKLVEAETHQGWTSEGLLLGAVLACVGIASNLCVESLLIRQPHLTWFSDLVAVLLGSGDHAAVTPSGNVAILTHEGNTQFSPSPEKTGLGQLLPFLAVVATYLGYQRQLWGRRLLSAVVISLIAMVLRGGMNIARFSHLDRMLSDTGPSKTELLQRPGEFLLWMCAIAIVCASCDHWRLCRAQLDLRERPKVSLGLRARVQYVIIAGALVAGLLFSMLHYPVGRRSAGRLLIDDTFSGHWCPGARLLTQDWYGDFSTYSFASATELLGYHFATDVNRNRPYDDDFLASYDVLIIKTPVKDIPLDSEKAIMRFVARGGGLFLIGDHTDLMGMSSRLNRFATAAGITFRSDSVADADSGAFSVFRKRFCDTHPVVARVKTLEFMTGCSLAIDWNAEPVIVVPDQKSQDHDYSNNSNFGSLNSDPALYHGTMVLCAVGKYGNGRILAFSDSTILSSFALFQYDRDHLLLDAVEYLNSKAGWFTWIPGALGLASAIGLIMCVAQLTQFGRRSILEVLLISCLIGAATVVVTAKWFTWGHVPLEEARGVPRVAILRSDMEGAIPPVLGSSGDLDLDWSYDTFLASIPRTGVMPRLVSGMMEARQERAIAVINPRHGINRAEQGELRDWVGAGGVLVVGTRADHIHRDALESYIGPFGLTVERKTAGHYHYNKGEVARSGSSDVFILVVPFREGKLVYISGTEHFSRKRLGHAFDIPNRKRRGYYAALYEIFGKLSGVAPRSRATYGILSEGN